MNRDLWWSARRWWGFKAILSTFAGGVLIGAMVGVIGVIIPTARTADPGVVSGLPGVIAAGSVIGAVMGAVVAAGVLVAALGLSVVLQPLRVPEPVESIVLFIAATAGGVLVCWLVVLGFLGWQLAAISALGAPVAAAWVTLLSRRGPGRPT